MLGTIQREFYRRLYSMSQSETPPPTRVLMLPVNAGWTLLGEVTALGTTVGFGAPGLPGFWAMREKRVLKVVKKELGSVQRNYQKVCTHWNAFV